MYVDELLKKHDINEKICLNCFNIKHRKYTLKDLQEKSHLRFDLPLPVITKIEKEGYANTLKCNTTGKIYLDHARLDELQACEQFNGMGEE